VTAVGGIAGYDDNPPRQQRDFGPLDVWDTSARGGAQRCSEVGDKNCTPSHQRLRNGHCRQCVTVCDTIAQCKAGLLVHVS
jgi:hypothetical protein